MMLRALHELAVRRQLVEDPLYEQKAVDFLLRIDEQGRFLALEPTRDEKGRGTVRLVPRLQKRAVNIAPGYFVDNPKYVLGIEGQAAPGDERKLEAFTRRAEACAERIQDAAASAVVQFLRDPAQRARAVAARPAGEWSGTEWIAFVVGSDPLLVHEREPVRIEWARLNAGDGDTSAHRLCLVTGQLAAPARLHPSIKRVPNAQPTGASLVSFNAGAFESHNLSQGANAPVAERVAIEYATALNYLLERTHRRFRQGIALGEDAVLTFWSPEAPATDSALLSLLDPTPEDVERLATAPLRGIEPDALDESAFYAVTLSGNSSRVVVRDYFQATVGQVKANVARYFEHLRLGTRTSGPVPIWRMLQSVQAPSGRGLSPDVSSRMLVAALQGRPFPRELLSAALTRLRLPADAINEHHQLHDRCALIKATLLRLPRSGLPPLEVSVSLDESNTHPPYVLGRLFAVLERLQEAALGSQVNTTIRERYFGAASRNPALTFPRLLNLSIHHAAKAQAGGWLEKLKGQVMQQLPPERFPRVLGLEDQGLFAIGYYHQREEFFRKRPATEPATTPEPDVL